MTTFAGVKTTTDRGALIKGAMAELHSVWNDTHGVTEGEWKKFFNVKTTDSSVFRTQSVSGASDLRLIQEGSAAPELPTYGGLKTNLAIKKFGGIITVTEEAIDDNEWQAQVDQLMDLKISSMAKQEEHAYLVLNNGWTTVEDSEYPINRPENGERLFSIAHAMANGETYSNTLVNSDALSADAVTKAKIVLSTMKSENGKPFKTSKKLALVVGPANEDMALRIVGSQLRAGTQYNDTNTHNGMEVIVSQYITGTAWFLVDMSRNGLFYVERQAVEMKTTVDFDTSNVKAKVSGRWAFGFRDFRGVVGSKGDASTITA